ncbi:hypothetical protein [Candidatus Nitrosotalea sp. TS]|uniref:hypothetical protein n=1 Tax=Candidatus Nitrosotalea sp. TS TaxID=2341020 RepID=UPI00140E519F|nr:hypothetical protein [Candidatus Nitrosotalea sp. TS]
MDSSITFDERDHRASGVSTHIKHPLNGQAVMVPLVVKQTDPVRETTEAVEYTSKLMTIERQLEQGAALIQRTLVSVLMTALAALCGQRLYREGRSLSRPQFSECLLSPSNAVTSSEEVIQLLSHYLYLAGGKKNA